MWLQTDAARPGHLGARLGVTGNKAFSRATARAEGEATGTDEGPPDADASTSASASARVCSARPAPAGSRPRVSGEVRCSAGESLPPELELPTRAGGRCHVPQDQPRESWNRLPPSPVGPRTQREGCRTPGPCDERLAGGKARTGRRGDPPTTRATAQSPSARKDLNRRLIQLSHFHEDE